MIAYDPFYPLNQGTSQVIVNMLRNEHFPQFNFVLYTKTVVDTTALGDEIIQVQATDNDGVRKIYHEIEL